MKRILDGARSASPYLLAELLLPGGTLIALLMWLYRHRDKYRPVQAIPVVAPVVPVRAAAVVRTRPAATQAAPELWGKAQQGVVGPAPARAAAAVVGRRP
jgi:hypothetical protein